METLREIPHGSRSGASPGAPLRPSPGGRAYAQSPYMAQRKSTDVFCLVAFVIMWLSIIIVAGVGFREGEPLRLFNGVDHLGRTCGTKGTDDSGFHFDFTNKDKIYYPELQKNLIFAFEQYPELYDPRFGGTSGNAPLYGICMAECPRVGDFVTPHDSNEKKSWKTFYNTSSVLNRCIADDVDTTRYQAKCVFPPCILSDGRKCNYEYTTCSSPAACKGEVEDQNPSCETSIIERVTQEQTSPIEDPLWAHMHYGFRKIRLQIGSAEFLAVPIYMCGGLFAFVLSSLYLIVLEAPFIRPAAVVHISIMLLFVFMAGLTLFTADQGGMVDVHESIDGVSQASEALAEEQTNHYQGLTWLMIIIDLALVITVVYYRAQINLAANLIEEAAIILRKRQQHIFIFVLVPAVSVFCMMIWLFSTSAYIVTAASWESIEWDESLIPPGQNIPTGHMVDNLYLQRAMVLNAIVLLWSTEFLVAITMLVVSGAISAWYWADKRDPGAGIKQHVWGSFCTTLRYHLGSCALGAAVIPFLSAIKFVFAGFIAHIRSNISPNKKDHGPCDACLQALVDAYDATLGSISSIGYARLALGTHGYDFISSLADSHRLLRKVGERHHTNLKLIPFEVGFLLSLIKGVVVTLAVFAVLGAAHEHPEEVDSPWVAVFVTAFFSFSIANIMLSTYTATIDALLICTCTDLEQRAGYAAGDYQHKELIDLIRRDAKMATMNEALDEGRDIGEIGVDGESAARWGPGGVDVDSVRVGIEKTRSWKTQLALARGNAGALLQTVDIIACVYFAHELFSSDVWGSSGEAQLHIMYVAFLGLGLLVWISFSLNAYNKVKKFMGPGRRYGGGMAANMDLDYEDAHTGLDAHGSACDPLATFVWFLFFPIFAFNISQPESRDMEGAQDNTVAEIQRDAEKWSLRSYFSTMVVFDLPLLIINILAMSLTGGLTFGSAVAFGTNLACFLMKAIQLKTFNDAAKSIPAEEMRAPLPDAYSVGGTPSQGSPNRLKGEWALQGDGAHSMGHSGHHDVSDIRFSPGSDAAEPGSAL